MVSLITVFILLHHLPCEPLDLVFSFEMFVLYGCYILFNVVADLCTSSSNDAVSTESDLRL
jgi:hypothetical protein